MNWVQQKKANLDLSRTTSVRTNLYPPSWWRRKTVRKLNPDFSIQSFKLRIIRFVPGRRNLGNACRCRRQRIVAGAASRRELWHTYNIYIHIFIRIYTQFDSPARWQPQKMYSTTRILAGKWQVKFVLQGKLILLIQSFRCIQPLAWLSAVKTAVLLEQNGVPQSKVTQLGSTRVQTRQVFLHKDLVESLEPEKNMLKLGMLKNQTQECSGCVQPKQSFEHVWTSTMCMLIIKIGCFFSQPKDHLKLTTWS
jgi:hypothetical protein